MTLEQQADLLAGEEADRIKAWELFMVAEISREIGKIGGFDKDSINTYDTKEKASKTEKAILSALFAAVVLNIKDLPSGYRSILGDVKASKKDLYAYRGLPFVDITDDKTAQNIISQYAKSSGEFLYNIYDNRYNPNLFGYGKKTTAVKVMKDGKVTALHDYIVQTFDDASGLIREGTTDFYGAMRKTVLDLGGSGAVVEYPNGWTRRLDTVVRQNLLYNQKMASAEYNRKIGEELGCDGIEVSFSRNPRPSHRFMEGKQYAKGKGKTVDGVYYEGAEEKGVYERLYDDYNCNHYETDIILGVSEPTYSPEELARLKAENERQFTVGDKSGDGYYWSQKMRALETEVRRCKDQINALSAFGNSEQQIKDLRKRIKVFQGKYNEISEITGIAKQPKRMSVPRVKK